MIRIIVYAAILIILVGLFFRARIWFAGMVVSSWIRNPLKNKNAGGKPTSLHLIGWAFDIVPASQANMVKLKQIGFAKVINEGDHIHVQII